jgi:adenylate kinase
MSRQGAPTILVCGISGVGKTKLLERAIDSFPSAVIWRAAEIIGNARDVIDPEALRNLPIGEIQQNQKLLVKGFNARRKALPEGLVFLDAHSVIDSENGLIDIPFEVARHLHPAGIIHISDDVPRILERRTADKNRVRPVRSLAQLTEYQQRSIASCERYSVGLNVPIFQVVSGDVPAFKSAVQEILASGSSNQ